MEIGTLKIIACLLFGITLYSCKQAGKIDIAGDPHSYARPRTAAVEHLELDIHLDFKQQILEGTASYRIRNRGGRQIILDTKYLDIKKVEADGKPATFRLGPEDPILGQALIIDIKKSCRQISIHYKTRAESEALQWLSPVQTADGTHPFLYTQGFPILSRSWMPVQDSPGVRMTYKARLSVPPGLMAVMSARNPQEPDPSGQYEFTMDQAVPSYMISLAVGHFRYRAISERTGVYAEHSMIDRAHYEFGDMELMLGQAEELFGPYAWEQQDVIVLPKAFPYGGMENPRLTFLTPTIIAGDRSLTSMIAHEISHAWSGNLVTNATFNDFWLNEGFTVYLEMRIIEALYGKERAEMLAFLNRQSLENTLDEFKDSPERQHLKQDLAGLDPDLAGTDIPYYKGYLLLRTIEEQVGRPVFDQFLTAYFSEFAFRSIDTETFLAYLNAKLFAEKDSLFNTREWIYGPGIPVNAARISSGKLLRVDELISGYLRNGVIDTKQCQGWTTQEWLHFLQSLPHDAGIEKMSELDRLFAFSNTGNAVVKTEWYRLAILTGYAANRLEGQIMDFLDQTGRRMLLTKIYAALLESGKSEFAQACFERSGANYHYLTSKRIEELLQGQVKN